ncbi:MAG: division/cell wall cluster transcriptional repressor MraZ [Actinobacteria bacterium]|nr:division/cell wall cluster transcriptional repressor MraZ [Actinomycetota bacterium]
MGNRVEAWTGDEPATAHRAITPMASFKGSFAHQLDDKGRLAFPAKLRAQAPEGGTVNLGPDRQIIFYPADLWQIWERRMNQLNDFVPDERRAKRYFFGWAEEVAFDAQGRITISPRLREQAGLVKEATIVGVGDRVEIWDAETRRAGIAREIADASEYMLRASEGVQPTT